MPNIKIIFSDVDGTILNDEHKISPANLAAISQAEQNGIPFVLVSSRPPAGMTFLRDELGLSSPIAAFGGGFIAAKNNEILRNVSMPIAEALDISSFISLHAPGLITSFYGGFHWFAPVTNNPWIVAESQITRFAPVGDLNEFRLRSSEVNKILCMGPINDISMIEKILLDKYPSLNIVRSKDTYLEISPKHTSKADAVDFLCEHFNIPTEFSLSLGDNYNDLDMLKRTGQSVAMGNAPEDIKAFATHITADNNSDGVAKALNMLGLV